MKHLLFASRAWPLFVSCGAIMLLGGCVAPLLPGSQSAVPSAAGPSFEPNSASSASGAVSLGPSASWSVPEAKGANLLYLGEPYNGAVGIFTYPNGKLVGGLAGFSEPRDLCVDPAGDVFVTDQGAGDIVEFPHGGTNPIKTLDDSVGDPFACAVDPNSGDLAVVGGNSLLIYKSASGTPRIYTDKKLLSGVNSVTYDDVGRIYTGSVNSYRAVFAVLSRGGHALTRLRGFALGFSENWGNPLQWVGSRLAVTDTNSSTIYKLSIQGNHAAQVGSTSLPVGEYSQALFQTWIHGNKVLGTFEQCPRRYCTKNGAALWTYPSGGYPIAVWYGGPYWGVTFSPRR